MKKLALFATVSSAAILIPSTLAALTGPSPASPLLSILMGEKKIEGGTTKLGEIDPAVIPTSGPNATGSVCNEIPEGKVLTDLDFSIKNGSAGSVSVGGGTAVDFDEDSDSAHVKITVTGNECKDYTLHGVTADGSGKNLIVNVTPSDEKTVSGNEIESNILPAYRFDEMSDLARNGVELHHNALLALVFNDDGAQSLTSLTGGLSFPGSASADLQDIHVFESDGDLVSGASVAISGAEFSITAFGGVQVDDFVQVLFVLDDELNGELARVQLQGTFAN